MSWRPSQQGVRAGLVAAVIVLGVEEASAFQAASQASEASTSQATPTTASEANTAAEQASEEITVVGEHAGPRLWKVHKGDHILWILGTVSPLPRRMIWQSDGVEEVLKQTQEVVPAWPSVGIGANPFTAIRLYIQWRRIQHEPDRMKLKDVLPPPLYARFSVLKARFDPNDDHIEELRPILAAERLLEKAMEASGLTRGGEVQQTVLKLAKHEGVQIHQDKLKVDDPVNVLKDVGTAPRAGEVACLDAVVTRLETDLGAMQARARAWALGDVDTLRKLYRVPDDRNTCIAAVSTSERVRNLITRASDDWMLAVEDSLTRNRATLAVQSMDRLLGDNGTLAVFKSKGYVVEGP